MNKSITQNNQNVKQISKSISSFFSRFHVSSALKASNDLSVKNERRIETIKTYIGGYGFFSQGMKG